MAEVVLFAAARKAAGSKYMTVEGETARDVIDNAITVAGPELASIVPTCSVMVDGCLVRRPELVHVSNKSEIALLPPVTGG